MATQELNINEFESTKAEDQQKIPRLFSLYKKSLTFLTYVNLFQRTCLMGFWLGVLPKEMLHGIDESYYNDEKMYKNDQYNRRGLFKWEEEMVNTYFQDSKNILLLSAGGGREVYGLQKFGCQVDAYECHPQLVNYANDFLTREGSLNSVRWVERNECPENGRIYDGAIVGWGGYMLIQSRDKRVSLLRKIREQIKPGAPILVSFFTRRENEKRLLATSKIANIFRLILQREATVVGDDLVPKLTYVHHFTKNEITDEFSKAGFKLEFFSKRPYGHAVGFAEKTE